MSKSIGKSTDIPIHVGMLYKFMGKIVGRWIVYEYRQGEFIHLSKPLPSKEQAEKERTKLASGQRKASSMGVGYIHMEE